MSNSRILPHWFSYVKSRDVNRKTQCSILTLDMSKAGPSPHNLFPPEPGTHQVLVTDTASFAGHLAAMTFVVLAQGLDDHSRLPMKTSPALSNAQVGPLNHADIPAVVL